MPNQLLHYDGTDASLTLTSDDWTKILGKDPEAYDYTGIDPHMIEAYAPREGLASATGSSTADPINGREWITSTPKVGQPEGPMPFHVDREYACTFPLAKVRDCTDPASALACDCPATDPGAIVPAGGIPPVCDATKVTNQIAAKVYPTPRELLLAHKMGGQGIAASLCPIHLTDNPTGDDPEYGYRPAVAAIVGRLKQVLDGQCLPQPLTPDAQGNVPCLILEALPAGSGTCESAGLEEADSKSAAAFRATLAGETGAADGGGASFTICKVDQLVGADLDPNGSCASSGKVGWCYVTGGANANGCAQAIDFSKVGEPANGARVSLECIQQTGGNGDD